MKRVLKRLLGGMPYVAELYQRSVANGRVPEDGYSLAKLESELDSWLGALRLANHEVLPPESKNILVFGYLQWWLEYGIALSLLLRSQGHNVTFAYLPFRRWADPVLVFDRRRQSEYLLQLLSPLEKYLNLVDLYTISSSSVKKELVGFAEQQSRLDVQYTLQYEDVNLFERGPARELYILRLERNLRVVKAFSRLIHQNDYDTIILPNGSILEFGILFRLATSMGIRTVTYEFGEQRERIWLAENDEVMRQDTAVLWQQKGDHDLTEDEISAVNDLYQARISGDTWENFKRSWQAGKTKGGDAVREQLNLKKEWSTVLLCTNVVGDSLALNRQLFTSGMADWLRTTVSTFAHHEQVNLIVRVHPGELLGAGHPSIDIVYETLHELPAHVHLVPPDSTINTYDLIEIADLGLVYTTTVGLEMAMRGLPVIVAGITHYRGKGFTLDPASLEEYLGLILRVIEDPRKYKLSKDQIDRAWHYAYLFFFEYPKAFPWHLIDFWDDIYTRPLSRVVQMDSLSEYRDALEIFTNTQLSYAINN